MERPLPAPDEASRPFFDAAHEGRLVLQRCSACGTWMYPVRPRCVECFSDRVEWSEASGKGTLYSFAIVHTPYAGFEDEVPYDISTIDLDERVRITATVVDCANEELRIGMPVEVVFHRLSDEVTVPKFRPVG